MGLITEEIPKILGAPHQKWGRDQEGYLTATFCISPNNELSWHMPVLIT